MLVLLKPTGYNHAMALLNNRENMPMSKKRIYDDINIYEPCNLAVCKQAPLKSVETRYAPLSGALSRMAPFS